MYQTDLHGLDLTLDLLVDQIKALTPNHNSDRLETELKGLQRDPLQLRGQAQDSLLLHDQAATLQRLNYVLEQQYELVRRENIKLQRQRHSRRYGPGYRKRWLRSKLVAARARDQVRSRCSKSTKDSLSRRRGRRSADPRPTFTADGRHPRHGPSEWSDHGISTALAKLCLSVVPSDGQPRESADPPEPMDGVEYPSQLESELQEWLK